VKAYSGTQDGRDSSHTQVGSSIERGTEVNITAIRCEFGRYSVVDGRQRITAISRFMSHDIALRNLESFHQIEGLTCSQSPSDLQNALDVRPYLRVITLLKQSDPTLKFEVFTRLNRGGKEWRRRRFATSVIEES
jgi:hypothetical protein